LYGERLREAGSPGAGCGYPLGRNQQQAGDRLDFLSQADLHGSQYLPFFAFPPPIRTLIYTTNAIESVNARLRKIIKTRGHFPNDDAATQLIELALRNITTDGGRAARDWKEAMNPFAILYDDRFTRSIP